MTNEERIAIKAQWDADKGALREARRKADDAYFIREGAYVDMVENCPHDEVKTTPMTMRGLITLKHLECKICGEVATLFPQHSQWDNPEAYMRGDY